MNKSVIVVGAGVVGLACGKELSEKGYEVFIAEQEKNIATETSARNSGVIHAGIYYPTDSLKAKLCIRGKNLLYEYCKKFNVSHSNTKKMIVATTSEETHILLKLKDTATKNGLELENLPKHFKKDREIVLAAVRNDGFAIADADSKFLDDKEIAIEAIKNNRNTFLLLNEKLTMDKDILTLVGLDQHIKKGEK